MVYLRKDVFPHVLFGTEKRTVRIRTVRFVLQVGESVKSEEKQLFLQLFPNCKNARICLTPF